VVVAALSAGKTGVGGESYSFVDSLEDLILHMDLGWFLKKSWGSLLECILTLLLGAAQTVLLMQKRFERGVYI